VAGWGAEPLFLCTGLIVSHNRPTLYSPSSRTALAEAELEYKEDHKSRSVYVAFPVAQAGGLEGEMAKAGVAEREKISLAVWTTTAWTLPSNVAIAVSETMDYTLARLSTDRSLLVFASARLEALEEILGATLTPLSTFPGSTLLQTTFTSPLSSTDHVHSPRPLIPASYVTATTGTGLVHTAPAHGVEDFEAWRAYQSALDPFTPPADVVCAVDGFGKISDAVAGMVEPQVRDRLVGKEVLGDATGEVIDILTERGTLLREVLVEHKFPYDWRTKKPVIFRASNQWFANLENVKEDAVAAINAVEFHPPRGRQTLEMFVRGRSEWCISRQRAWGVPLPIVYSYPKGAADPVAASTPHLTPASVDHIVSVLDRHASGTDYWWEGPAEEFVEPTELERSRAEGREWRKGLDTMDVWFDSGCSWTLLREEGVRPEAEGRPLADVYLEGSDQHRGWFQSSLLTKISATAEGEKAQAPYGTVITHGMVLDEKGRKMSKSLGNVLSPFTVINGGKVSDPVAPLDRQLSANNRADTLRSQLLPEPQAAARVRDRPAAGLGRLGRLDARRPDRPRDPGPDVGRAAQDPQHGPLHARQPPRPGRRAVRAGRARTGRTLYDARAVRVRPGGEGGLQRICVQQG